jgi:type VI secretion system protein ImpG
MNNLYYSQELESLRKGAVAFAARYPALAPMLARQSSDPDVERVLEGAAYLCGQIRERLDENSPQLIQALLQLSFPQALLPLPSSTLVRFTPGQGVNEPLLVPANTRLAARPVNGVSCVYSTQDDLTILPITISGVSATQPGSGAPARVSLSLRAARPLAPLIPRGLVLHLPGEFDKAAQRFFVLLRQLEGIEVQAGTMRRALPPENLRPYALPMTDSRLPFWRRRNRPYMEMVRVFHLPEQLLFMRLDGLDDCLPPEAAQADIHFLLGKPYHRIPDFDSDSFCLNTITALNIVPAKSEPVVVNHTTMEYPIRPQDAEAQKLEILAVERVESLLPGGTIIRYSPYDAFLRSTDENIFHIRWRTTDTPEKTDCLITPLYGQGGASRLRDQTMSVDLLCCNYDVPDVLRMGDVSLPTDNSPVFADFVNITDPTPMIPRPQKEMNLWLFLAQLRSRLLPSASADLLRAMLELYIYADVAGHELVAANKRRCDAILEFSSSREDRLFRGQIRRGWGLYIKLDPAGFGSMGGMYLFASALDRFLSTFASANNYTRLTVESAGAGERLEWPPRMGESYLL